MIDPFSITLLALRLLLDARAAPRRARVRHLVAKSDATTVFRSARDLITDGEWAKAQQKFSEYV